MKQDGGREAYWKAFDRPNDESSPKVTSKDFSAGKKTVNTSTSKKATSTVIRKLARTRKQFLVLFVIYFFCVKMYLFF